MSDNKLRCALVYRLDSEEGCTLLAKYDHASDYEGGGSALYGDRDKNYAEAVGMVVGNDPPSGVSEEGVLGGFKVVKSDMHQVVYGADCDGLCELILQCHCCIMPMRLLKLKIIYYLSSHDYI